PRRGRTHDRSDRLRGAPTATDDLHHIARRDRQREEDPSIVGGLRHDNGFRLVDELTCEELDELPHRIYSSARTSETSSDADSSAGPFGASSGASAAAASGA